VSAVSAIGADYCIEALLICVICMVVYFLRLLWKSTILLVFVAKSYVYGLIVVNILCVCWYLLRHVVLFFNLRL